MWLLLIPGYAGYVAAGFKAEAMIDTHVDARYHMIHCNDSDCTDQCKVRRSIEHAFNHVNIRLTTGSAMIWWPLRAAYYFCWSLFFKSRLSKQKALTNTIENQRALKKEEQLAMTENEYEQENQG